MGDFVRSSLMSLSHGMLLSLRPIQLKLLLAPISPPGGTLLPSWMLTNMVPHMVVESSPGDDAVGVSPRQILSVAEAGPSKSPGTLAMSSRGFSLWWEV